MSAQHLIYISLAMCAVMVIMRTAPMLFMKNKVKNKFLQSFLAYIPCAVLTSMTFPEVFSSTSNIWSASAGALAAIALAYFNQGLIVVTLSSTAVVFIVEQLMNLVK